jgi:hypothetical protein
VLKYNIKISLYVNTKSTVQFRNAVVIQVCEVVDVASAMAHAGYAGLTVRRKKMPQVTIVYWRDMPAQVIVKAGRKTAKRQLPERFEQAIDRAAMKTGAASTDDYLAEWRRGDPYPVEGDDLEALVEAEATRLDTEFDHETLKALIEAGGHAAR